MKRTDKSRLDWFNNNGQRVIAYFGRKAGLKPEGWFVFDETFNPGTSHKTVRQAIDAAMKIDQE